MQGPRARRTHCHGTSHCLVSISLPGSRPDCRGPWLLRPRSLWVDMALPCPTRPRTYCSLVLLVLGGRGEMGGQSPGTRGAGGLIQVCTGHPGLLTCTFLRGSRCESEHTTRPCVCQVGAPSRAVPSTWVSSSTVGPGSHALSAGPRPAQDDWPPQTQIPSTPSLCEHPQK